VIFCGDIVFFPTVNGRKGQEFTLISLDWISILILAPQNYVFSYGYVDYVFFFKTSIPIGKAGLNFKFLIFTFLASPENPPAPFIRN